MAGVGGGGATHGVGARGRWWWVGTGTTGDGAWQDVGLDGGMARHHQEASRRGRAGHRVRNQDCTQNESTK